MSIIVMGMEMPMDCNSCCVPGNVCDLWIGQGVGNRHPDCPIRQLPEKHGRLIDIDDLYSKSFCVARVEWGGVQWSYSEDDFEPIVEAEGD